MVFGMFPTLCMFISCLITQPAVGNVFQLAGLCWCEFGDFSEVFSTLCFGRLAPTELPNCRALIQTEGGKWMLP